MNPEPDPELESLLDSELKQLSLVSAPPTLVRKVLAALEARAARPWWQRAWWDWPVTAQAAFFLLALSIVAAISTGGFWIDNSVSSYSQQVSERLTPLASTWDTLSPLSNAGMLLWEKAQPLLFYGVILAGALYLLCVGVGTMFFRVALKRA
jgi:hypothetical protein